MTAFDGAEIDSVTVVKIIPRSLILVTDPDKSERRSGTFDFRLSTMNS